MKNIFICIAFFMLASCLGSDTRSKLIDELEKAQREADYQCEVAYDCAEIILDWCAEIEDEQVRDTIEKYAERITLRAGNSDAYGTIEGVIDELKSGY